MRKVVAYLSALYLFGVPSLLFSQEVSQRATDAKEQKPAKEQKKAKGKWNGEFAIDGASNFHLTPNNKKTHNIGGVNARIGYSTDKFNFDISSRLSLEHRLTGEAGGNINIAEGDTTKKVDASVNENSFISSVSGVKFGWKPDVLNRYNAYYNFSFDKNSPMNYNVTTGEIENKKFDFEYSKETGDHHSGYHKAGFSYDHDFPSVSGILSATIDLSYYCNSKYSEWATGVGKGDAEAKSAEDLKEKSRYRTTPTSNFNESRMAVKYSDKKFLDVDNLDMDFTLSSHFKNLNDHISAANYIGGQWRDSTSYRENFRYRTLKITPQIHAKYSIGIYKVDLSYYPEYFMYKLDGDSQKGKINRGRISNLLDMTNIFTPWDNHTFNLKLNRREERPDYLQICWFPRSSSIYANEIYMGNTDLQSSITTSATLSYEFRKNRFTAGLVFGCVLQPRKICLTYNTQEYNGKEYRVYTWVNGGQSIEGNSDLNLGWKDGPLDLGFNAHFNIYKGYSMSGSETKSNSYSFSARGSYQLKTWTFQGNVKYASGVTRTYYSITSIIDGNFRVTKAFGDHFKVYLEGVDLLDRPVTVKTTSDDEKQIRYERHQNYKRLVRLGVTYRF